MACHVIPSDPIAKANTFDPPPDPPLRQFIITFQLIDIDDARFLKLIFWFEK